VKFYVSILAHTWPPHTHQTVSFFNVLIGFDFILFVMIFYFYSNMLIVCYLDFALTSKWHENCLSAADVPLTNYSLTHTLSGLPCKTPETSAHTLYESMGWSLGLWSPLLMRLYRPALVPPAISTPAAAVCVVGELCVCCRSTAQFMSKTGGAHTQQAAGTFPKSKAAVTKDKGMRRKHLDVTVKL